MGNVSASVSLFLFWCVRLKEKPLRLGSVVLGWFFFPVFPSFFLLFFFFLCLLLSLP